ncbi:hypothetical protein WDV93_12900 [Pantoea ananatis]
MDRCFYSRSAVKNIAFTREEVSSSTAFTPQCVFSFNLTPFLPVYGLAVFAAGYQSCMACHGSKGSQLKPLKRSRNRIGLVA